MKSKLVFDTNKNLTFVDKSHLSCKMKKNNVNYFPQTQRITKVYHSKSVPNINEKRAIPRMLYVLLKELPFHLDEIRFSTDIKVQIESTKFIYSLTNFEESNSILSRLYKPDIIPKLILFLTQEKLSEIHLEICSILKKIVGWHDTLGAAQDIIKAGGIPILVKLFVAAVHLNHTISAEILWLLGCIVIRYDEIKSSILEKPLIDSLKNLIKSSVKLETFQSISFFISQLCTDHLSFENLFPLISDLIYIGDELILFRSLEVIHRISLHTQKIKFIEEQNLGILKRVIDSCLYPKSEAIQYLALQIVGNIIVLQNEIFSGYPLISTLLKILDISQVNGIRKEVCWIFSNLTSQSVFQIETILKLNVIPNLLECLKKDIVPIKVEVCWSLSNIVRIGTTEQIRILIQNGVFQEFCSFLSTNDTQMKSNILESLWKMILIDKTLTDFLKYEHIQLLNVIKDETYFFSKYAQEIIKFFQEGLKGKSFLKKFKVDKDN